MSTIRRREREGEEAKAMCEHTCNSYCAGEEGQGIHDIITLIC